MKARTKITCPTVSKCAHVIAEQRKFLGMTQKDLAEKSGLSKGTIACFEIPIRAPSITSITKIAEDLDLSLLDFFELVDAVVVKRKYRAKVKNEHGAYVGWRCQACGKEHTASPELKREIKALRLKAEECCGEV